MVFAPSLGDKVPSETLVGVEVIPVVSDESLQKILVAMYADNPSPFVLGPKSTKRLRQKLDGGIQYVLVRNNKGEFVGARAFDSSKKMLQNTVTDYRHRGKGYQLAAGLKLMKLLASEGHTEFHALVLRTNTRIQRTMQAAGWELEPDPDNPNMIRGTRRMNL